MSNIKIIFDIMKLLSGIKLLSGCNFESSNSNSGFFFFFLRLLQLLYRCTDNVDRRVWEHNNSPHNTFTSKSRPWILVAAFSVSEDMGIAMKAERFIKKQKSRAFIEKICSMEKIDLPMAQLVIAPKSSGLIRGSSREQSDPGSGGWGLQNQSLTYICEWLFSFKNKNA